MSQKKESPALVDPMTVDWTKDAFAVGSLAIVKDSEKERVARWFDISKPLKFSCDDGTDCPFFQDWRGIESYLSLRRIVPLSKVQEYQAALAAQKGTMNPQPKTKPAKADPVAQAITEAQERVRGLTELAKNMADLATRKGDVKRLAAKVKEGRAKWMPEAKKAGKKVK